MAPPVLTGTESFGNAGGFPNHATELVTRVHTGGKLLIIWCGQGHNISGGTQIPDIFRFALTGLTNPVLPTTLLVDQMITASGWGIKVWRSTDNLPPGSYSAAVAITGLGGSAQIQGSVFLLSVNNWAGNVASIIRANASATTTPDRSHTVTTTVNDLPVAIWTYTDNATGGVGPSVSGNTVQQAFNTHQGGGVFARIASLVAKETGIAGTTTLDCTDSGYGTIQLAISVAFALTGNTNTQTPLFVGGNLNFSGAVTQVNPLKKKSIDGSVQFAGAATRQRLAFRSGTGSLSFSGALAVARAFTQRFFIGLLRFSGDTVPLVVSSTFVVIVSGTVAFSGALGRSTAHHLSAILSFAGGMTTRQLPIRMLEGTLSFSGTLARAFIKASRRFIVAAQRRVGYKRLGDNP